MKAVTSACLQPRIHPPQSLFYPERLQSLACPPTPPSWSKLHATAKDDQPSWYCQANAASVDDCVYCKWKQSPWPHIHPPQSLFRDTAILELSSPSALATAPSMTEPRMIASCGYTAAPWPRCTARSAARSRWTSPRAQWLFVITVPMSTSSPLSWTLPVTVPTTVSIPVQCDALIQE